MIFRRPYLTGVMAVTLALVIASASAAFSVRDEIKLGEDASKEVQKKWPLSKNETWQKDIDEMGKKLTAYVKRKDIPYHFYVVQADNELNAFALPGGYVYFTERMWKIMTPDERAAVMAHEITHCDHRHGVDMMLKSQRTALWSLPLLIATGGAGEVAWNVVAWGGLAIQERYSRKMERDADESGIKLCAQAGYNPAGAVTSMIKLLHITNNENHYEVSDIFADHPDTQKRIDYLTKAAISLGADKSSLTLKAVDDPTRIGNITGHLKDLNMMSARTSVRLKYGQKVAIKKVLWDDDKKVLMPKTIAILTVLTPGNLPILVYDSNEKFNFGDIMEGDGVYPIEANPPASNTPAVTF